MAIQFPNSPNLNDTHVVGNVTYTWNGNSWDSGVNTATYDDSSVATYLNGNLDTHIVPDTNAQYDIGTAEYKVRHLFLSDNSLKFTDTSDPNNIVEYAFGRNGQSITFNGNSLNTTSYEYHDGGTPVIDVNKRNHFVTNGVTPLSLPNGTEIGQELHFWRAGTPGAPGLVDINVDNAIWTDVSNNTTLIPNFTWRLGTGEEGHTSCIWTGSAWVLGGGSVAV